MSSISRQLLIATACALVFTGDAGAQTTRYWNPSPLTGDWNSTNNAWSATSGGTPTFGWTSATDQNAVFDQAGTYTVNSTLAQTAGTVTFAAGNVTLTGSTISSNAIDIASGATLTGGGNTLLKVGTTSLTVNGTLNFTSGVSNSGQRVTIAGGNGTINGSGGAGLRTSGAFNFAGDITGAVNILTDTAGTFTLGGNNTHTGEYLFRHGNTVRLNSANALSSNAFLRVGGGTVIFELAAADFSRTVGSGAAPVRFHNDADGAGSSGFAAINADRNVTLNGTVLWGGGNFNQTIFHLGTAASTHTVNLTTGINLNAATRTINTANGSAAIEAEISGALSNGTLLTTGNGTLKLSGNNSLTTINKGAAGTDTGTLILSGSNTFSNATLAFGTEAQNRGAIRLESNGALGGVTTIDGRSGTGSAQARIELANNVTISGTNYLAGGRSNQSTTGAAIVNVSGNNTWTGIIQIQNTGGGYGIRSDAGRLTLSGILRNAIGSPRVWELGGTGDLLLSGQVVNNSGQLGLTKFGSGTMTVTGNTNTYTGGTTVGAGTLLVNNTSGSGLGTGAVTVNGGTLGGTGAFSGSLVVNNTGTLSPGASIESLATGAVTFNSGSTFAYEFNTNTLQADLLNVNGNLTLNGVVSLNLDDLGSESLLAFGTKFTLISYSGIWNGNIFNGFADDSIFSFAGNDWRIDYNDTIMGLNGGAFANGVTITAVPEPSTALLIAAIGVGGVVRHRRKIARSAKS